MSYDYYELYQQCKLERDALKAEVEILKKKKETNYLQI